MNKIIKVILIALFAVGLTAGCGCGKKEEKKTEEEKIQSNTNKDVIKDQEVEVFKFTNTSLVYENGTSVLETTVTNTSNEKQYLKEFKIHVYNSKGSEMVTLTGFVGDSIDGKGTKVITSSFGEDLTKAAKIEYEIIR